MSEERATYGEEQPDITDDNWKLAELERLLADKEKELQRARTAINNLLTYDTCKEHREKIGTENWVNVYKERQAFGCVYCTKEKVEEAKEKAKRLEAEMAAMRQALDDIMTNASERMWPSNHARKALLATDAGKAMLERMVKQEKALRAWRAWCLDERHSIADDTQLFEAAIELMDDALDTKEAQDTTNMCPKCGKALMGKPLGCVIHGLVDPIEEAPDV